MELISRNEAILINQAWFFTGIPCKNGHIDKIGVKRQNCYQCRREYTKLQRLKNPEQINKIKRDSYHRNKEQISQKRKENYYLIKDERSAYHKEWYSKNKETVIQKQKERYEEKKEEIKKYKYEYYKRNSEQIKAYFRELAKTKERQLSQQIHLNRRMALKKTTEDGTVTKQFIFSLIDKQNSECVYCKKDLNLGFHIDHIQPLSKDGKHISSNIQLLCPTCNISKGNREHPNKYRLQDDN